MVGEADPRCLASYSLAYSKKCKHRAATTENVRGLVSRQHALLACILKSARDGGYTVKCNTMHAEARGLPHHRSIVYVVAMRNDPASKRQRFIWRPPLSRRRSLPLPPLQPHEPPGGFPAKALRGGVARQLVKRSYRECLRAGVGPRKTPVLTDRGCTPGWYQKRIRSLCCRTASRGSAWGCFGC